MTDDCDLSVTNSCVRMRVSGEVALVEPLPTGRVSSVISV